MMTVHRSSLQLYAVLVKEHDYDPHHHRRGALALYRDRRAREESGRPGAPIVVSDDDSDYD